MANANSEWGRETEHKARFEMTEANNNESEENNTQSRRSEAAGAAIHSFQWPDIVLLAEAIMWKKRPEMNLKMTIAPSMMNQKLSKKLGIVQTNFNAPNDVKRFEEFIDMIKRGVWRVMKR